MLTVILASASPARARLLLDAGVRARQIVSGVDEDALIGSMGPSATPTDVVGALADAKARAVARTLIPAPGEQILVIGCDSVLDMDGRALGKPADSTEARQRWQQMRGESGALRTGHSVIDVRTGEVAHGVESTLVRFGTPSDAEVDAYIATGEPLRVAGAFTLDGLGAAFVDGVDGDPSNVIGLSLPLLRTLVAKHGVTWSDLWNTRGM